MKELRDALKAISTEEEYESARRSTPTPALIDHYIGLGSVSIKLGG
jgi:hypothetical protein